MQIFLFFALIIAVLAVFFAVQNSDPVQIRFAVWEFNSSLASVLLLALTAGVLISVFVSLPSNVKARWTIRQQRKKLSENETSLAETKARLEESEKKLAALQSPPSSQNGVSIEVVGQDPAAKKK
jgi:uncharacterized integral membrane protein